MIFISNGQWHLFHSDTFHWIEVVKVHSPRKFYLILNITVIPKYDIQKFPQAPKKLSGRFTHRVFLNWFIGIHLWSFCSPYILIPRKGWNSNWKIKKQKITKSVFNYCWNFENSRFSKFVFFAQANFHQSQTFLFEKCLTIDEIDNTILKNFHFLFLIYNMDSKRLTQIGKVYNVYQMFTLKLL